MPGEGDRAHAERLDAHDGLARFRERFAFGDDRTIYMDGNSLGRPTHASLARLRAVAEQQWRDRLIRGWGEGWYEAPARVGERLAALLGAAPGQVLISDATSVNLFKLALAALRLQPQRPVVVSDTLNFPSDLYVLQGCLDLLGGQGSLRLVASEDDGLSVSPERLLASIDEQTALVALSHVAFKSGYLHDAAAITARAHQAGALVLWDLSHSAGVVPIELDRWGVDLAVGCTYKYLNGGPGAPAFLYVARELQERLQPAIQGWFGEAAPFAFGLQYRPAPGIARFQVGTPPILSLAAVQPGLEVVLEAGIGPIRDKSVALTSYCIALADDLLAPLGFALGSPREEAWRGSQVSLRHPEGYRIARCLIEELGVLPDFREPDSLRLGLAPLYTRFVDVWDAVDRLARAVREGRYRAYPTERGAVT